MTKTHDILHSNSYPVTVTRRAEWLTCEIPDCTETASTHIHGEYWDETESRWTITFAVCESHAEGVDVGDVLAPKARVHHGV